MEDEGYGYIEEEILEIVRRYERMRNNNENAFFDVAEFETIIDYYLELNDVHYASEAAEAASEQHPAAFSIQIRKAKVFIDRGRPVDALKIARVIEKVEPSNYEVLLLKGAALGMLGDLNGTRKYFDMALSVDESEEANILQNIAGILNNLNHYSLLTKYLKRLLVLEPEYSSHLYDLAYTYEKLGELSNSIKYYEKYLEEEPFSDNAWYNAGLLYSKKGLQKKALESYDYALAINPDNYFALFNMANIYSREGRYAEALDAYLHYLDFEEDSSEAITYAAECYERLGRREKALELYNEAIDIDPDYSEPWYGIGLVLLAESPAESIKFLSKAVSLKDDEPEYWFHLSQAYSNCMRQKDAFRSLIRSVNINPYYNSAWLRMGEIIISGQYYGHAAGMLEKGIKVIGDVHGIRYLLASIYLYKGQQGMFLKHLEKALNDSPGDYRFFRSLFPVQMIDQEAQTLINKR